MTDLSDRSALSATAILVSIFMLSGACGRSPEREVANVAQVRQDFGEQLFVPRGGFILKRGQSLPSLEWEDPEWIAEHVGDAPIRTRWFNERLEEVSQTEQIGRYYVYGEASGPGGPALRRAMTCCYVGDEDLTQLADRLVLATEAGQDAGAKQARREALASLWQNGEEGAIALAEHLEAGEAREEPRAGQWQMENATRHVRLKRKLMGLDAVAPANVKPRGFEGRAAPVLRRGTLQEAGVDAATVDPVESSLDAWYALAQQPTAIVIARNGVIVVDKSYGSLGGRPVTTDTPLLLHSAMKPLIGLQLAMYVDRGHIGLDEPIGKYLPDFAGAENQNLTFRAGHVHATGIHFPWEIAFQRLFYFRTWQDSMISHRAREWAPGERHKYGVVGIVLAVRALELMSGQNYWHAMERELFEPLGCRNILPGGTGFSAENLARIGLLLANEGKYGDQEFISEETYRSILPTPLEPYFSNVEITYGIGLRDYEELFGPGSYGHGGGCGTQLIVNPEKRLVFAMSRNERGDDYKAALADVLARVVALTE